MRIMAANVSRILHSPARLAALRRLALLDTPPEAAFDRLAHLASRILRAPVALVSLVDEHRQFFKSCVGLPAPWASWRQTPVSHSFCQHVVATHEPLIIEDARNHPLVRDNPGISDLGMVAYAGIPLVTADGHVVGSFCVIDHNPRKWTEEEIGILKDLATSVMTEIDLRAVGREVERLSIEGERERREKATLLDATIEGIYGIDREGCCTFINRAAAGLFGYRPHEVVGKNMHGLIHHTRADGSPYPLEACPIARVLRTGEAVHLDNEIQWRRDGTSFLAECSSSPIHEDGRIAGAVVTVNDVTERKRAEEASQQLAAIVASSEDAIIANTLEGVITSWNTGAERLYGYTPQEALGRPITFLYPPERPNELPGMLERLRRGERIEQFETQRMCKDGRRLDVSLSISPVRDARGQIVCVAGIAQDITERKRAEVERARLLEALAERERQLRDLVGRLILAQEEERRRVAYELHDGVAQTAAGAHLHLRGFTRRYPPDDPEASAALEQALELAQRTVREVRTVVGALRPTVLDDLGLEAALEAEVEELRKAGWHVEYEAALGSERLAPTTETALFRVAQEALRNTRKHAQTRRARVALRRRGPRVQLEVEDSGRGFDPAAARADAGPGERVGLSGIRERVGLLGGRCEVQSRPGAGTRIVAEVPLRPPEELADVAPADSQ